MEIPARDCCSSSGSQAHIRLATYSRALKETDHEICRFLA
jgi:hypothetical protein